MAGKRHRQKGDRVERECVDALRQAGVIAKRVPLSGAVAGYPGDIEIQSSNVLDGVEYRRLIAEVKARKSGSGFKTLEQWKGDNDFLFLKRNNRQPMVVMDWDLFLELMR